MPDEDAASEAEHAIKLSEDATSELEHATK